MLKIKYTPIIPTNFLLSLPKIVSLKRTIFENFNVSKNNVISVGFTIRFICVYGKTWGQGHSQNKGPRRSVKPS